MTNRLLISELLTEEQCAGRVAEEEVERIKSYASEHRRSESLTWRAMLYDIFGRAVRVEYDKNGAPTVVGEDVYIGVSHTKDRVAVVVSSNPCAVDIERKDRNFSRAATKFLTVEERRFVASNIDLATIWCAKECYYKLRRDSELDMLQGIKVVALDAQQRTVTVEDNKTGKATLRIEDSGEHIIVYIL